ncbi:MAG: ComF family protein [candidate division Zixibacteria bacterium]|nr:ComF family protein [candidate division Zixibacteria bacterium]
MKSHTVLGLQSGPGDGLCRKQAMASITVLYNQSRLFMKRQVNDLLDFVYPPVCGLCGHPADSDDRLVCRSCWNSITTIEEPFCLNCREFIETGVSCPWCDENAITVFSLGIYDDVLRSILHDLKFGCLKPLAEVVGAQLAALIDDKRQSLKLDMIVPVPLHSSRLYHRGFNQAEEIAREIGRCLDIPCRPDILYLTRKTRRQSRLSAAQREANVRGAYAVAKPEAVKGRSLLLVDDITTTGATLRENVRVLKAAGAGRVTAAVGATVV